MSSDEFDPEYIVESVLKSFTYKPSFKARWFVDGGEAHFHFSMKTTDVETGKRIEIHKDFALELGYFRGKNFREFFISFLWDQIRDMEIHEAGEWFSVNGSKPFYPSHD